MRSRASIGISVFSVLLNAKYSRYSSNGIFLFEIAFFLSSIVGLKSSAKSLLYSSSTS